MPEKYDPADFVSVEGADAPHTYNVTAWTIDGTPVVIVAGVSRGHAERTRHALAAAFKTWTEEGR